MGFAEATSAGAGAAAASEGEAVGAAAGEMHFLLAEKLLERLVRESSFRSQVSKEERKVLFSMLAKVHFPIVATASSDGELLGNLLTLIQGAFDGRVAVDATSRNTLTRMREALLKMMNSVAAAERGGGGEEETVLETTEMTVGADATEVRAVESFDDEEDDEEDEEEDVTAVQKTLRDTTLGGTMIGGTTIGAPDAEGTRVQLLAGEDSEMVDVDDGDEYTEISEV